MAVSPTRRVREWVRRPARRFLRRAVQVELTQALPLALDEDAGLAARHLPEAPGATDFVVPRPDPVPDVRAPEDLPLPPQELRVDFPGYREAGARHWGRMHEILEAADVPAPSWGPVLDFGCGTGRMTRQFLGHVEAQPVWGVDLDAESVSWCQRHLSPPFRFATVTSLPHLPFEDATFGLVVACSVFTHISDLADSWLLEVRRVLRPGGVLYATVQDQAYVTDTRARRGREERHWSHDFVEEHRAELDRLGDDLAVMVYRRGSRNAMVFHDRTSLLAAWGQHFDVLATVDGGYDSQTAVVLRKPIPS